MIAACAVMLSAPFLLLAGIYDALPAELPIVRSPLAGVILVAPKSVFTVFRVPLMNLTHALLTVVMLSRAVDFRDRERRRSYFACFSTLLFAIALKSDFEALEFSGLVFRFGWLARLATAGTVLAVVGGLILACVRSRRAPMPWRELRLSVRDKAALVGILVTYLAAVMASLLIAHPA